MPKKARIVIGSNYGDEGKGTVVAHYTKNSVGTVLNILTNGGAQRGHSILTEDGNITFKHFGSGTYHGADSYYSRFFILNPMQFVSEYESLIVKPKNIYRDINCRWSTPYDIMANLITENLMGRKASCGMGIWNTVKRYQEMPTILFDDFIDSSNQREYLNGVRAYYNKLIGNIPSEWKKVWDSEMLQEHFINDCNFVHDNTTLVWGMSDLEYYDNLIFENGQGLLLCDTGKDTYDTTPSNTGSLYASELLFGLKDFDVTAHYVTRPYLTRHGDGGMEDEHDRDVISAGVNEDRTNHYNNNQGAFRYGNLNLFKLKKRIDRDNGGKFKIELDITHCDEMDRVAEFSRVFDKVNVYDNPLIK